MNATPGVALPTVPPGEIDGDTLNGTGGRDPIGAFAMGFDAMERAPPAECHGLRPSILRRAVSS